LHNVGVFYLEVVLEYKLYANYLISLISYEVFLSLASISAPFDINISPTTFELYHAAI